MSTKKKLDWKLHLDKPSNQFWLVLMIGAFISGILAIIININLLLLTTGILFFAATLIAVFEKKVDKWMLYYVRR